MDIYKEFNHNLKFFMRELMKVFPQVSEIKLMFALYKLMKTVNKKSPQQYFHSLVDVHSKELLLKDINYFLSKDFDDPQVTKILEPLKREYVLLDVENQDMIWKHLVVLYHMSIKCEEKSSHVIQKI
jgi:hypothetical protein